MSRRGLVARALALAFLAGDWTREGLLARGRHVLGSEPRWLPSAVKLVLRMHPTAPTGRDEQLTRLLARSRVLRERLHEPPAVDVRHWLLPEPAMAAPSDRLAGLPLPQLASEGDVCSFLALDPSELAWLADLHRMNRSARDPRLQHYVYRWVPKRSGTHRLLEAPKPKLKAAQRRLLGHIVQIVPTHAACHGFELGRSVSTFAAPHTGQSVVLAMDLEDFFIGITEARVRALFRCCGYPDRVAAVLAGLCCTPTPPRILRSLPRNPNASAQELVERTRLKQRLRDSHLPQGAPTAPALANRIAFRLDARLAGLARAFDARYTRYADDLAFSGGAHLAARLDAFIPRVGAIVQEEGFRVRFRKTRVMRASTRQQLCGVVVNQVTCIPRGEYERLEAILINCVRRGAAGENREGHPDFRAHVTGRVAWVSHLHPAKGARLTELLRRIAWE